MAENKKGSVADQVRVLAKPLAEALGLDLWDVRFLKEGADWILRIIIDKDNGVSIDDCVAMNDALDQPLDELNPIDRPYRLQVQSPGAERDLIRDEHFEKFIGSDVKIRLHKALNERKEYAGVLISYDDGQIVVHADDGTEICVNKSETSFVRLDDFKDFF